MTYNITLTANHQSLTAKYLPLAAESVQYLTAKVVYETDDWTGREIKAMFGQGCTVYEVPVTGGEITAKQQLNLTAGDWRVWLVGNSARDGEVIPRITTNMAHISVAPTGGTEGSLFPTIPPTAEEQLRADMGNLADLTTEDKSSLVAAINEVRQTGGVQSDWNQNDETQLDYVKNRPFYTGDPVETVLVEESTVSFSFSENEGAYIGELKSTFSATVGETYKVSWDGTAYECTCIDFSGMTVIGNLSIAGAGSDTGEPFVIVISNNDRPLIATADTSASHTFSISGTAAPIVKIPAKYIDKNSSGYVVIHSKDTMTEEEVKNYKSAISTKEVVFIIWNGMCISRISFGGTTGLDLQLTTQNNALYFIEKNADGLFAFSNRKFSTAFFPSEAVTGDASPSIYFSKKEIRIIPSTTHVGVGSTDTLFQVRPDGTKSKAFDVLGNGEAVAPALILYSSTAGSTKKFKITVDDSGTITATEVS